tara:strand:+ start:379 stop:2268 length:1890 start_codon:yes stop_codon:yes gene_type:complete
MPEWNEEAKTKLFEEMRTICEAQTAEDKPLEDYTYQQRSDALSRWFCENVIYISNDEIDDTVSVGSLNEYGVDFFHAQDEGDDHLHSIIWGQTKFSLECNYSVTREEMETFGKTIEHLKNCPSKANHEFKKNSVEFVRIVKNNPNIKRQMYFLVAGELGPQAKDAFDELIKKYEGDQTVNIQLFDINEILDSVLIPRTPDLTITLNDHILEKQDVITKKTSTYGFVSAENIRKITKKHKGSIFKENPREQLGRGSVSFSEIKKTLDDDDEKKKFWKYNNGITATCESLEKKSDNEFLIKNLKIVNGRQTTYSFEEFNGSLDDVEVSIAIHEVIDEDEGQKISQTTNTQNPIRPIDRISGYPELKTLELQCKREYPEFYFERQTNSFKSELPPVTKKITKRRLLEKNSTARGYMAYAINPSESLMPDSKLYSVFPRTHFDKVFADRDIRDLIIPHIFKQLLIALGKKWAADTKNNPPDLSNERNRLILQKEVVKHYILRFIYTSLQTKSQTDREKIQTRLVEYFKNISSTESIAPEFLKIAEESFTRFMVIFDLVKNTSWPKHILDARTKQPEIKPEPPDIMYSLKKKGAVIFADILDSKKAYPNDPVSESLSLIIQTSKKENDQNVEDG